MAIYHYSVNGCSPARGSSPVASAAYQAGIELVDERTGEVCRYSRTERVREWGILTPSAAPEWAHDPQRLWNECLSAYAGGNALAAVRRNFALPRELTEAEQKQLVMDYANTRAAQGLAVQWAIHDAEGNPHAHIIESAMKLTGEGFERTSVATKKSTKAYLVRNAEGAEQLCLAAEWKHVKSQGFEKVYNYLDREGSKVRLTKSQAAEQGLKNADRVSTAPVSQTLTADAKSSAYAAQKSSLKAERALWADIANKGIEAHNQRTGELVNLIDHRSNAARGMEQLPTKHVGPTKDVERIAENEQIKTINAAVTTSQRIIATLKAQIERVQAWWQRKVVDPIQARRQMFLVREHSLAKNTALVNQRAQTVSFIRESMSQELVQSVGAVVFGERHADTPATLSHLAEHLAAKGIEMHATTTAGAPDLYFRRGKLVATPEQLGTSTRELIGWAEQANQLTPAEMIERAKAIEAKVPPQPRGTETRTTTPVTQQQLEHEIHRSRGIKI